MTTVTVLPGPERRRRWTTAEKLRKGAHKVLATWSRSGQKIYVAAKALFWPDSNNVFRCI
jgi:hypothetical protein